MKYVLMHSSGRFFKDQNLYLGTADLSENIDEAKRMSAEKAERKFALMNEPSEWEIHRIQRGWRLAGEYTKHLKKIRIQEKKSELDSLMKEIEDE
ncbi:MAG: hypothetical protein SVK08_02475 [Halobacteriota archaeon]|nr:hypothetical protein [Halobacteriota archaeon]